MKLPTVDIKGKEYVLVKDRILEFNKQYPNGMIETKLLSDLEADRVYFKAVVVPDSEKPERRFTGHSQAKWGDGYINQASAVENAETSAVGRALALMGIGVIDGIASADEIEKAEIQSKMTLSPATIKDLGDLLDSKGITSSADKNVVLKAISGGGTLNTSAIARLKKEIEAAAPDTLQAIVMENQ